MVRLQGLHRKFRLRPLLGTGIVVVAFDKLKHRMPTNPRLVRTFCPAESVARLIKPINMPEIRSLTSGAMNSGVPQKVLVLDPYHMSSLQRP